MTPIKTGSTSGYAVSKEVITFNEANKVSSAAFEVKKNVVMSVFANKAALNTAGAVKVNLLLSYDGANFTKIKELIADIDTAFLVADYDFGAEGGAPWAKIELEPAADEGTTNTVEVAVVF